MMLQFKTILSALFRRDLEMGMVLEDNQCARTNACALFARQSAGEKLIA